MKRGGGREGGRGRCTATLLKKVNDFPVPRLYVTCQTGQGEFVSDKPAGAGIC
jgi:hypothetical protein